MTLFLGAKSLLKFWDFTDFTLDEDVASLNQGIISLKREFLLSL